MVSYLVGTLGLVFFVLFFYAFGSALRKDASDVTGNLLIGYIAHSLLVAIAVIPIQLGGLTFTILTVAVLGVLALALIFTGVRWASLGLSSTAPRFGAIVRENYFLVLITIALFVLYLLQTDLIWNNNHTDDGYYLLKIANLAYAEDPYGTINGTGYASAHEGLNTYHLSSIQSEMAVYSHVLGIDPAVFTRGFLNIFHYFLAAVTVSVFGRALSARAGMAASSYQYMATALLILSIEFRTIEKWQVLAAQDLWQFNGAMWYGGTLGRVAGMMWLLAPYLNARRLDWKIVAQVGVISVVLISKAAATLPIIIIAGLGYLVALAVTSDTRPVLRTLLLAAVLGAVGWVLTDKPHISALMNELFTRNLPSIVLWGSVALIVVAVGVFRTRELLRMAVVLATAFALMVIPELNDILENAAVVDFVARRAQTATYYTLIITAFISLSLLVVKFAARGFALIHVALAAAIGLASVASTVPVYGNPLTTLKFMAASPHIMPQDTALLSQRLEQMADGQMYDVYAPEWVEVKHRRHYVATILRVYAPHVRSVSAIPRFGAGSDPDFASYQLDDQSAYDTFTRHPSRETFENLNAVLEKFPIEAVVMPNAAFDEYAAEAGFTFAERIGDYWIYVRG